MTQYFLTLPHDSAEEPTMADMDPDELQAVFAAVEKFHTELQERGRPTLRRWPPPAVDRHHRRQHR